MFRDTLIVGVSSTRRNEHIRSRTNLLYDGRAVGAHGAGGSRYRTVSRVSSVNLQKEESLLLLATTIDGIVNAKCASLISATSRRKHLTAG